MNTLIVYATKHGCAAKCAALLGEKLAGQVAMCDLKKGKIPDVSLYDTVVIGGSVYIGQIQKEVKTFSRQCLSQLKNQKIGLFISCMQEGEAAVAQINASFPQELLDRAVAKESFGGEFNFAKMNPLERFIVKKVSKTDLDLSSVAEETINRFAQRLNNAT